MSLQGLAPPMQDAEKADVGAKMSRVGGYLDQCSGAGLKQESKENPLALLDQRHQAMRNAGRPDDSSRPEAARAVGCCGVQFSNLGESCNDSFSAAAVTWKDGYHLRFHPESAACEEIANCHPTTWRGPVQSGLPHLVTVLL
jgi:hypothetical protein